MITLNLVDGSDFDSMIFYPTGGRFLRSFLQILSCFRSHVGYHLFFFLERHVIRTGNEAPTVKFNGDMPSALVADCILFGNQARSTWPFVCG